MLAWENLIKLTVYSHLQLGMKTSGQDSDTGLFWTVPQRTEQWNKHKLLWNFQRPSFPELPVLRPCFPATPRSSPTCCSAIKLWVLFYFWVKYEEITSDREGYRNGCWKRSRSRVFPGTKTHLWAERWWRDTWSSDHMFTGASEGPPLPHHQRCNQHFWDFTSKGHLRTEHSEEQKEKRTRMERQKEKNRKRER